MKGNSTTFGFPKPDSYYSTEYAKKGECYPAKRRMKAYLRQIDKRFKKYGNKN